ncbi:MAG: EutN/CcmL family microcompartment protein [Elusimicrobia bacterium]|nr:EutN/CcmL family microcompartment protein [Elusimicrobiota bacterium]
MFIAKVIGNVWATRKHPGLKGATMLLVKAVDPLNGNKPVGEAQLALDGNQGAGTGDTVLIVDEGGSARKILRNSKAPVRTVIAGIVDKVHITGEKS